MAGRPRKYETPEEMQETIDAYFAECEAKEEVPLLSGVALALGFSSRQSLYDYAQKEKFSYILDETKTKCEHALNKMALHNKLNANMAKMNLASSYGFSDRQQVEHSNDPESPIQIIIESVEPKTTNTEET